MTRHFRSDSPRNKKRNGGAAAFRHCTSPSRFSHPCGLSKGGLCRPSPWKPVRDSSIHLLVSRRPARRHKTSVFTSKLARHLCRSYLTSPGTCTPSLRWPPANVSNILLFCAHTQLLLAIARPTGAETDRSSAQSDLQEPLSRSRCGRCLRNTWATDERIHASKTK